MKNKPERLVYFNGKFVKESDAKVSIYDSSLMFGDMVFEMTRSFRKKHFKLKEHIKRLFIGLKILKINIGMTENEMYQKCILTSKKNEKLMSKDDEHRLMIDVSRGILDIYQGVSGLKKGPNVIIADFPLRWTVRGMGKLFDKGINAVITSQRAIPSQYLDPKIKNRSRLFYLKANMEASLFKGDDNWAIMLDDDGYVTEGTGDNFFIIKDKKIITSKGKNILRGISREFIFDLAKKLKIKIYEENIEPYDVYEADEAFMTGTPFCILPVVSLNQIKIGDGKPGAIFKKLLSKWSSVTGVDIKSQIQSWNKKDIKNKKILSPYSFN
tara:strand:- start:10465 stop:11442 length:978 start_codon:yes stop_codon:yes gene_type:complete